MSKNVETKKRPPEVPSAPPIRRRLAFHPTQAVGMAVLLLLPVAAAFGVLQSSTDVKTGPSTPLALSVQYPGLLRFRPSSPLEISVRNESGRELGELKLKLNREYLETFENPEFDPSPQEIDARDLVFAFEAVKPGETRRVCIEFEANQPGWKEGTASAETDAGESSVVEFSTFVLP